MAINTQTILATTGAITMEKMPMGMELLMLLTG